MARPLPPLTPDLDWASTERLCRAVWGVPSPETLGPFNPGAVTWPAKRGWPDMKTELLKQRAVDGLTRREREDAAGKDALRASGRYAL
jgi:hypothetical protein